MDAKLEASGGNNIGKAAAPIQRGGSERGEGGEAGGDAGVEGTNLVFSF